MRETIPIPGKGLKTDKKADTDKKETKAEKKNDKNALKEDNQIPEDGVITKEVANYALDLLDVDKFGLDHIDRNILITMIEKFQGGPVGLETLAASISEDAGTLEDVYEPYLLKNGFIQRTPRGRVVTELAYQHLGIPREV